MTSNELKTLTKDNYKLKGGCDQENIEINEQYLDKILKNNNT